MVPERPCLNDRELINECFARPDTRKTDARYAIHLEGKQNAVPVDRGVFVERIRNGEADVLTFAEPQQRRR